MKQDMAKYGMENKKRSQTEDFPVVEDFHLCVFMSSIIDIIHLSKNKLIKDDHKTI